MNYNTTTPSPKNTVIQQEFVWGLFYILFFGCFHFSFFWGCVFSRRISLQFFCLNNSPLDSTLLYVLEFFFHYFIFCISYIFCCCYCSSLDEFWNREIFFFSCTYTYIIQHNNLYSLHQKYKKIWGILYRICWCMSFFFLSLYACVWILVQKKVIKHTKRELVSNKKNLLKLNIQKFFLVIFLELNKLTPLF